MSLAVATIARVSQPFDSRAISDLIARAVVRFQRQAGAHDRACFKYYAVQHMRQCHPSLVSGPQSCCQAGPLKGVASCAHAGNLTAEKTNACSRPFAFFTVISADSFTKLIQCIGKMSAGKSRTYGCFPRTRPVTARSCLSFSAADARNLYSGRLSVVCACKFWKLF